MLDNVRKLVTHRFTIDDVMSMFETSADPKSGAMEKKNCEHRLFKGRCKGHE